MKPTEPPVTLTFREWQTAARAVVTMTLYAHEQNDPIGALEGTMALLALARTHRVPRGYRRAFARYFATPMPQMDTATLESLVPPLRRLKQDMDRTWLRRFDQERARRQA